MTQLGMELTGLEGLRAAIAATTDALTSPATAEAAARAIAAAARPLVPVESGTLLRSEQVTAAGTGATLVWAARYAPIVSARQPWLGAGITAALPTVVQLYESAAADAWHT